MAETTTDRLLLPRWSAPTDTPSRVEFDTAFANLEARAAGYLEGTTAGRPAASALMARFFYWDRERRELTTCIDTTGAGGWAWVRPDVALVDEAFAATPPNVVSPYGTVVDGPGTNHVPNPSLEVDLATWQGFGTVPDRGIDGGVVGGSYLSFFYDAAFDYVTLAAANRVSAAPGEVWTASAWLRASTAGRFTKLTVVAYDSAGNNINAAFGGRYVRLGAGADGWVRASHTLTLPAGTVAVGLVIGNDGTTDGVNHYIHVDGVQLEQASRPSSYIDGSLGPGYAWSGTPHASVSTRAGGMHVVDAGGPLWTPPNQVGFLVQRNSNQALPDSVSTKVSWNGELWWYGTPAPALQGTTDVVIPVSGMWVLSCYLGHNSNATGNKSAWFHGVTGPGGMIFSHFLSGNSHGWGNTRPTHLEAGTLVGCTAYFAGGTVRDISGDFYGMLLQRTA